MDAGKRLEAEQSFQKAISITPEMANQLQHALLDKGVQCIVAPYEADAQMAHLVKQGLASGVITEDSDMLPYGIETVVYKMDKYGQCSILDAESISGIDAARPIFRWVGDRERVRGSRTRLAEAERERARARRGEEGRGEFA